MVVPMAAPRADGRGEQPAGVVVGSDELSELAHRVVVPVVRLRRQQHDDPELVTGRPAELVGQQVDDLRCPQKLVLQVDEALGAADRAHIALEDAELTYRDGLVHVLGDGPHDLDRGMAGSGGRRRSLEPLAAELTPPQREVVVYVEDGGTSNPGAHVVPAEPPASGVVAGVEPITPIVGHVDPADERDLAVDDHGLLVVAVEGVLARIGLAANPGAAGQLLDAVAHLLAGGVKRRHRRSGPHQHSDVDPFGRLGQQLAEHRRPLPADELEVGRHVPPGHVDVVTRARDRLRDGREGRGSVDEHVQRAAVARRRIAGRPDAVLWWRQGVFPAEAAEAPSMLGAHRRLNAITDEAVEARDQ